MASPTAPSAPVLSATAPSATAPSAASGSPSPVTVGIGPLSPADVVAVARHGAPIALSPQAIAEITASRAVIEALANDVEPHYGVSTGFGALANRHIPLELRAQLQRSLIRSHAAGSGAEVEVEVVGR